MSIFSAFFATVIIWTVAYCLYLIIKNIADDTEWEQTTSVAHQNPILREYELLSKQPSGSRHARQARKLHSAIWKNIDNLFDILLDDNVSVDIKMSLLMWSTDHYGSCALRDNPTWASVVFPRLWQERNIIGGSIKRYIEWLREVHGYGEQVAT